MLTFVVAHYLYLKQNLFIRKITEINFWSKQKQETKRIKFIVLFYKFKEINKKFVEHLEEVSEYNQFIRRSLTIYCVCSTLVISCSTFVLVMTDSAIQFKLLFTLVDIAHIFALSLVIRFCSRLPSGMDQMSIQNYNFLSYAIHKRRIDYCNLLKVTLFYPFN